MSRRKTWWIVSMLSATATAGYIVRVNVSTAGPLLMREFGLSQVAMGRIFSAFLLGYALFQVPAGALADRWGARRVLAIAAWFWVIFTVLQAIVGAGILESTAGASVILFMVIRFLLGITASPAYPGAAQGVSKWVLPHQQGRANGIVIASIGLGSAIAPPLVSNVMVHWGWRPAMVISAIPALIIALVWLRIREPQRIDETTSDTGLKEEDIAKTEGSLRSPAFILLTISYTLQGYVGYIFVTWFYLYLVQERHFGLLGGAWMSSLPWVLSIISIPLGGYISDRLSSGRRGPVKGRRIIPVLGMVVSGIFISIGAHTGSAVMAALSLALATALILCVEGPFWTMMMRIAGKRSGTAGGIMNMGSNIGGLISPALTPLIASWIGWENALHVAAILAVIGGLLWFRIKPAIS
ncbi:MAG: MFS transporter [Bacteroidales bacterium]|jgi:ACS family glucarate transporter-like MFS transporter